MTLPPVTFLISSFHFSTTPIFKSRPLIHPLDWEPDESVSSYVLFALAGVCGRPRVQADFQLTWIESSQSQPFIKYGAGLKITKTAASGR